MSRARFLTPDQLGPHFDDGGPLVFVDNRGPLMRRPFHRQKAHLILSALYHRVREAGDRATLLQGDSYREALRGRDLQVIDLPSWGLRRMVRDLARDASVEVLPARGFLTTAEEFRRFAEGRKPTQMVMDQFYREVRRSHGILVTPSPSGPEPVGGQWNYDRDNRQPPPKGQSRLGVAEPHWPVEDDIDRFVRDELDEMERSGRARFIGADGPRLFAVTRSEALTALHDFLDHRLDAFGPYEDAAMTEDWAMAHSLLSVPLNLGLLDPREVVDAAFERYAAGRAPLNSVEGFVRQIVGWREWVWHLYWWLGEDYVERSNHLGHTAPLPSWWQALDSGAVSSACLRQVLSEVHSRGWTHHINRLMVLGNFALQRGFTPAALNRWFVDAFVDGTPWVMPANVVGMSQYADGGIVATKPYVSGGSYLKTMTNYCQGCPFSPTVRLGEKACPFTAGYWAFLDRHAEVLRGNHRMAKPLAGRHRLADLPEVVTQEATRTRF